MEKKQTRVMEKLFISEFSEDFFTGRCQSEEGLEDFIRGCADKVKERKEKKRGASGTAYWMWQ